MQNGFAEASPKQVHVHTIQHRMPRRGMDAFVVHCLGRSRQIKAKW